jgi:hypothetical protein
MSDRDTSRDQVSTESAQSVGGNPDWDIYMKHNARSFSHNSGHADRSTFKRILDELDQVSRQDCFTVISGTHNSSNNAGAGSPLSAGANQTPIRLTPAIEYSNKRVYELSYSNEDVQSQPKDLTTITQDCVQDFTKSASDQNLRERLSLAVEERVNKARAECRLPSLRDDIEEKQKAPPSPQKFCSPDDMMAVVRNMSRSFG